MNEVPVEDRQDQRQPSVLDLRFGHEHPNDRPIADLLEQEPVVDEVGGLSGGIDSDLVEPIEVEEWFGQVAV
jgi:hypothetical protein